MKVLRHTLSITQIARIAANIMVRLNEQDRRRIYVVRKTAEDIKLGSWADCETINNLLSEESRSQDALSAVYRQLDKAEMGRVTGTPEWNATRVQVRQWLYNKFVRALDEPLYKSSGPEDEQPASPAPLQTLSYPLETWERVMQVGPDDESSVLREVPYWFTGLGPTIEQSLSEASSSYETTSVNYPTSTAGAVIPYGYFVDAYNEATSGFSDASPALLSLAGSGTEALGSLAMNTHSFPITQALSQQTLFVRDVGTAATFDQSFAETAQRASSTCLSGQAQQAAYNTAVPPSSYVGANMLVDTNHFAVDNTYVTRLEHGLPDSPTLSAPATSTELERLAGHTASELIHYQTPHFSDYPNLSAEVVGQVDLLAWDNAQIALSLDGLERLLAEEEFDSSST
ncbi:hypothetical protein E8E12_001486 [Didymella heteroderae]|uniref:Uncharacterized protein n=1 Tax=Didymella heteroderae TaxID=1769908 RepID=A0A9P4WG34_9PLEO|nr:hypothetical protein E8E12_001486 [Didymella heteroderae]